MRHCIEQGHCSCVTGNCIAVQFKELEAQLAGLKGLVAVHLGEFSNESEEALMKALEEEVK
jgi:hypothetical protein